MSVAVLAEKPSVARDIARVLGASKRGAGHLQGNGYIVTWAIGHLVALAEPHQIRSDWKRWRPESLPMIPEKWPLEIYQGTGEQYEIVERILNDRAVTEIICATDAGREGELIFRYIYERCGCSKPVRRLWISSLTSDAIRAGFANLRDGAEYDGLADAARGRSRADWLVGMNLSRSYTLCYGDLFSVGRVQTPTLAMLVERELAIRAFVPEDYREVVATFSPVLRGEVPDTRRYEGVYFRPARDPKAEGDDSEAASRLPADGEEAAQIVARAGSGDARIDSLEERQRRLPPPRLYDLTELQRHANRLFGFSAKRTLELAQSLYERKKLLSYPRSDSRHLSTDVAAELPRIALAICDPYRKQLAAGTGSQPLGKRFVDDARVSDHHAIIPTTTSPARVSLTADEARIYDLVCRRLLSAWHEDHLYMTTRVVTSIRNTDPDVIDHYRSTGTRVVRVGWKALDLPPPARKQGGSDRSRNTAVDGGRAGDGEAVLPPELAEGQVQRVLDAREVAKRTRPPRRLTDATLLTAMETAGRQLDEPELADALRDAGLGTPATRAAIIETLLARGYIERAKKSLVATEKGIRLIEVVHPEVKSPAMTGRWESRLGQIERGSGEFAAFMSGIEAYVRDVVSRVAAQTPARPPRVAAQTPGKPPQGPTRAETPPSPTGAPRPPASLDRVRPAAPRTPRTPTPPDGLGDLLRSAFAFRDFRPYQEAVCRTVSQGEDVLLVMPTGAGKSLCYQLPGIARAGTTLVISPLIALMEDQVAKLAAQGFAAERIHSGRARADSQRVAANYLDGQLDFLFIAPERLKVAGFPELLARRTPTLIAIDEAHCISQWGHDFRPDYRMLKERLRELRPAPVIALTATATPIVQNDIVDQLGLRAVRYIHGFRRDNIGIELVEMTPGARNRATAALLDAAERRPAIVYAPTRKKAEALAKELGARFPCDVYHAGLGAARRDQVQAAFLSGELDAIVATIAFGMGIDKPDVRSVVHLATPGSLESYYQEIGRAGRDAKPSRAVLFHSFADRRTHEWFLDRDYPDEAILARVHEALPDEAVPRAQLQARLSLDPDLFEKVLEKLWIHGGAVIDGYDQVSRGSGDWPAPYREQRANKLSQLAQIARFTDSRDCRMLHLVQHFGDQADSGEACGSCDICDPSASAVLRFREPTLAEQSAMERILKALQAQRRPSTGRLHRDVFGQSLERKHFERLLTALCRGGLTAEGGDAFEREGEVIEFRRAWITDRGRRAGGDELARAPMEVEPKAQPRSSRTPRRSSVRAGRSSGGTSRRKRKGRASPRARKPRTSPPREASSALVAVLRSWRLAESKRRRIPAFRIFGDSTLVEIAAARPRDEEALLAIRGVGATIVRKYGDKLLRLIEDGRGS